MAGSTGSSDQTATDYGSFVIRWRRRPEPERIEVEHVQSGERTRVSSVARAISWMRRRVPVSQEEPGVGASGSDGEEV